jgi:DNA-binding NtrC family response regulator
MSSKNNKIMVIDDNDNTNNIMKFFLQKEDYNVDSFTNSIEAIHSFRKDEYDLVLLDSKMQKLKEEMSLYKKFKEIDNKVSICFTNADRESVQEIKQQVLQSNNNNNNNNDTMCKSLSLNDDQTKLDILLLNDKDIILIKS